MAEVALAEEAQGDVASACTNMKLALAFDPKNLRYARELERLQLVRQTVGDTAATPLDETASKDIPTYEESLARVRAQSQPGRRRPESRPGSRSDSPPPRSKTPAKPKTEPPPQRGLWARLFGRRPPATDAE